LAELPVFLFDIDGVLVAPYGYRAAVRATLGYFYDQMNLPERLLPDENVLAGFEAIRITSEWDMVPICLAAALDSWLAANPGVEIPGRLADAIWQIKQMGSSTNLPPEIDYLRLQRLLRDRLPPGIYPADTVLELAIAGESATLFGSLMNNDLLEDLLAGSRDLDRSLTTRLFQHYTLGSAAYQASYRRPAMIQTPSLLASLDQPQLSQPLSRQITRLQTNGNLFPAAFTMRPSLAPRGVDGSLPLKYVPEAEIALELVGLAELPLIGYGRILYLADQLGLEPESLLKPSPVQAIAAILAAIKGEEGLALLAAYNVYAKYTPIPAVFIQPGDQLQVFVFEDSAGGIEAVYQAAEILRQAGVATSVSGYGIATHPEKIAALESVKALLYPSTEQAIRDALLAVGALD
jgi:hypothetical protein